MYYVPNISSTEGRGIIVAPDEGSDWVRPGQCLFVFLLSSSARHTELDRIDKAAQLFTVKTVFLTLDLDNLDLAKGRH